MSKAAKRGSHPHAGLMARLERRGWAAPTILTVGLLLAVALRGLTLYAAPSSGYLVDHLSFMSWSERALANGPTALYDVIDETRINAKVMVDLDGHWQVLPLPTVARLNYPPLACNILWLQGALWHWLDPVVVTTHPAPPKSAAIRETPAVVTSHLANTPLARFVNAFPAIMAELLMAWGVALLVRVHCRKPGARVAQSLAFVLTLNAPPIILDSAHWSQTDAWIACPLVWCLYLLLRGRYVLAGLVYGAALMTKPQAVLFVPVLAYAFCSLAFSAGGSLRRAARLLWIAPAVLTSVALISAPFLIADWHHPDGGALRWFNRSYVEPITGQYQFSTMYAFNVWWLELIAEDRAADALESTSRILGFTKDSIGKALLAIGLIVAAALCARRWRWSRESWLPFTFLVMLAAFILPTRVHERYIYYCLPFLFAAVFHVRAWSATLCLLMVTATMNMTWYLWYVPQTVFSLVPSSTPGRDAVSAAVAGLAAAAFIYSYAVLWPRGDGARRGRVEENRGSFADQSRDSPGSLAR